MYDLDGYQEPSISEGLQMAIRTHYCGWALSTPSDENDLPLKSLGKPQPVMPPIFQISEN